MVGVASGAVTLVIPARDAVRTLPRCLQYVARLDRGPSAVLVVDDGSSDGTASHARAHGAEVLPATGEGLGSARNDGLVACRTRYLAFLNADCYPERDWLEALLEALQATAATVAGGQQIERRGKTLAERWKAQHLDQNPANVDGPDYLSGGNLLLDLDRLPSIRFDARYRVAYEDVDFCRRVRARGGRLVHVPEARVVHDHRETLATLPGKVWSYGAASHAVQPVTSVATAARSFVQMHGRPHDQVRLALIRDLRQRRLRFAAVDVYLLFMSLLFAFRRSLPSDFRLAPAKAD